MSQVYFSRLNSSEKIKRLVLLASLKKIAVIWSKGDKKRYDHRVLDFNKDRLEIILETKESHFGLNQKILFSFELKGRNFFSEAIFQESISGKSIIQLSGDLFSSERRSSYRLLTYSSNEVYAEFDLGTVYEESGNLIDIKSGLNQTDVFRNFLEMIGDVSEGELGNKVSLRLEDLSTTGMAILIGELERQFFQENFIFHDVNLRFKDELITIPKVKVVYIADKSSEEKKTKLFKLGLNFEDLPKALDDKIGKKINNLLRENDLNNDFENFLK